MRPGVVQGELDALQELRLGALDLVLGDAGGRDVLEHLDHALVGRVDVLVFPRLGHGHEEARFRVRSGAGAHECGEVGRDQRRVQVPGGLIGEDQAEHLEGSGVGMGAGADVIGSAAGLNARHALERDVPSAVLDGLDRIGRIEDARGARDGAEVRLDQLEGPRLVELARDDQERVVRLVVPFVEALQVLGRDALDVAAVPDGRETVVVPEVGRGDDALAEHATGLVLTHLELVADHAELPRQVLGRDPAVHHPVRLHVQGEDQVLVRRRQRLEVVRAVQPRRAVEARSVVLERSPDVLERVGALEHHVLEQVGHPLLAAALVAGADHVGHVYRELLLGRIGKQEDAQPIVEDVLGDALDRPQRFERGLLHGGGGRLLGETRERSREEGERGEGGGGEAVGGGTQHGLVLGFRETAPPWCSRRASWRRARRPARPRRGAGDGRS